MLGADAFGRLEGVVGVGEVHVRVGLVYQLVQGVDGLHHGHLSVGAATPLHMLRGGREEEGTEGRREGRRGGLEERVKEGGKERRSECERRR